MNQVLVPKLARFIVLGPTVLVTYWLGAHGYPLIPRVGAGVGLGLVLIMLVSQYQRRRGVA
jgi:hypothetical protein